MLELRTQSACGISIHALREESDGRFAPPKSAQKLFLSTLSVRRATITRIDIDAGAEFLSTLSVRRATQGGAERGSPAGISIHALREESDKIPAPQSQV